MRERTEINECSPSEGLSSNCSVHVTGEYNANRKHDDCTLRKRTGRRSINPPVFSKVGLKCLHSCAPNPTYLSDQVVSGRTGHHRKLYMSVVFQTHFSVGFCDAIRFRRRDILSNCNELWKYIDGRKGHWQLPVYESPADLRT